MPSKSEQSPTCSFWRENKLSVERREIKLNGVLNFWSVVKFQGFF